MSVRKMILGSTLGIAAAAALVAAYAVIPRPADLRAFDPAEMARLETAMWRDYYDKRHAALFYHLYESTRTQFGFSPLRSLQIALGAAGAARTFQPTRSRREADAALPALVGYYRDFASATRTRPPVSSLTGGRRGARRRTRATMASPSHAWRR
ncbi:hypothetical protein J4G43_024990 [Bradyrhizobium barranii subsp. barranii]|uniref:Uncharacterized protein n=1 Tax=Bradyrhizobium barranii subsp. barranii TaxID=2823807 RepID=A0A939S2F9_9BRAD|nr:hypothetical protein [Bradyrhizobium barranii]UEM17198.1 hypothetical protein J4G43_024990 [Bradyrhizobium barranii subsp. barranii]